MNLENVVPWGRSFREYEKMFCLDTEDLCKSILGCADGPASFNAELTRVGGKCVSVDPIYQFSREEIDRRVKEAYSRVLAEVIHHQDRYLWRDISDPQELGRVRMLAMQAFLQDYDCGIAEGRYIGASLPFLPFEPGQFQLALCSHYLFLCSAQVDEVQHLKAVNELCRVAEEVRIYPLVTLAGELSAHVEAVMRTLGTYGIDVQLQAVPYRFQEGAHQMMVLRS